MAPRLSAILWRQAPFAAVELIEFGGIEPVKAGTRVAREFAEDDPAIEVVHVDPDEIQSAAERLRQREHEFEIAREFRVGRRARMMRAPEGQAVQAPVIVAP